MEQGRFTGSGWVLPVGKKTTVPNALQIPLPSGTTCQLPPPLGEEALGWVGALGTANQRLPCAKGAAPKGLRDCTWRGMLRTTLPSALRAATSPCTGEARVIGFCSRTTTKPLVTCCFLSRRRMPTRSLGCSETNFSTHQPARTATIESDVKSLCPFSGRHKGRTV